jgi:hypothetical protein
MLFKAIISIDRWVTHRPEDGNNKHHWNVGKLLPYCRAQHPGNQPVAFVLLAVRTWNIPIKVTEACDVSGCLQCRRTGTTGKGAAIFSNWSNANRRWNSLLFLFSLSCIYFLQASGCSVVTFLHAVLPNWRALSPISVVKEYNSGQKFSYFLNVILCKLCGQNYWHMKQSLLLSGTLHMTFVCISKNLNEWTHKNAVSWKVTVIFWKDVAYPESKVRKDVTSFIFDLQLSNRTAICVCIKRLRSNEVAADVGLRLFGN